MGGDLSNAFKKLAFTLLTIVVVVAVGLGLHLSFRDDFALVWPDWRKMLVWLAVWAGLVLLAEVIGQKLGVAPVEKWQHTGWLAPAIFFVGMVILAPIGEELVFRGLMYWRLTRMGMNVALVIGLIALAFGVLHIRYGWLAVVFIVLDGLFFGVARYHSGSVILPIFMHAIGNLYSWQQHLPSS
jgi:CAAX protease family protein